VFTPHHRALSLPYSAAFLVSTLLFGTSALVPEPWRYYMWGVGLLLSVTGPLVTALIQPSDPRVRAEQERSMTMTHSAVERFGLLTIIVLGEVIIAVVQGLAGHHHLSWTVGGTAGLGLLLAMAIWWLYFDFVSHRLPVASRGRTLGWMYLHLPMMMGIVAAGAATLNVVEHAEEHLPDGVRWLIVGAVMLTVVCVALLMVTLKFKEEYRRLYRRGIIVMLLSALVVPVLGVVGLSTIPLLAALNLLLLIPVVFGTRIWIVVYGADSRSRAA
jgi:low temperature requirement protein LtrA